ncbi:MAG TPA: type II secretion system F family protein [Candidatus Paceibacterota bacterium]|nr:type II secretion system F family protein [Verrucomicrobiota bacterium]HOX02716.1 type II secretion system F family protein [Verrucomicrobiota bacterium]HRZ45400.1 type II secretion system F family protein [Candidatus Paceibacterota bacterium]HRZ94285.1 type II secretion system F family protein [Candidatus Paceibacterota bacterium]
MPQFTYKARRRSGELIQARLEVPDRAAALSEIERMGLIPISVDAPKGAVARAERPASGAREEARGAAALLPRGIREIIQRRRRPKLQELATFTQQLANLLHSGMPLTVALNSMTHLESKGVPPEVSRQLRQDVMEGRSLSDAMAKQPHIFTDLYVNMVRAGEQSGALEDVLRRLAAHYERFAEVQSKFVAALIYPAIVATVGIVIIFFFMSFMLPKFLVIFEGMKNVQLPSSTRLLIGISDFFHGYWWLLILMILAGLVLFKRFQGSSSGRRTIDGWKMGAPVIGKVIRLNLFAQFSRTLATLLVNGVPVLTALKISEQVMPNVMVREAIARTREEVTDGKTIAQPLARSKLFPQLMIDLLQIGEETGDVPGALRNIADTYENELGIGLRVLTNLIEPAMIILMALGVGFLLFSVLSAMFAITSNIAR